MISLPFRRLRRDPTIDTLYGTIVAQARSPVFYRDYGVPDTVLARLDMIMLHLVLVLRRLRDAGPDGPAVGQRLFDHF
jgi:cytochrome b pre-mRNA-processing protein 3